MSDVEEYVVVKRTTTAEVWVPRSSYMEGLRQMTDAEILEYEKGLNPWDALNEIVSVTREERISHVLSVSNSVGSRDQSDV